MEFKELQIYLNIVYAYPSLRDFNFMKMYK